MHAKLVLWADAGLQAAELGWQGWWARSWPNEARLYGGWASFQKFAWAPRGLAAPSLAQLVWVRLLLGLPLFCLFESARVALAGPGAIFCCGRQLVAIACLRPCLLALGKATLFIEPRRSRCLWNASFAAGDARCTVLRCVRVPARAACRRVSRARAFAWLSARAPVYFCTRAARSMRCYATCPCGCGAACFFIAVGRSPFPRFRFRSFHLAHFIPPLACLPLMSVQRLLSYFLGWWVCRGCLKLRPLPLLSWLFLWGAKLGTISARNSWDAWGGIDCVLKVFFHRVASPFSALLVLWVLAVGGVRVAPRLRPLAPTPSSRFRSSPIVLI